MNNLFIVLLLFCTACQAIIKENDKTVPFSKKIVWRTGENEADGYRIPGIVVTPKGTLLAIAEERPEFGDADPKSIVVKRCEYGTQIWSENIYIEKSNGSYWSENADKIDKNDVADKKEVWTNPAALVDKQTGKVFIFYALSEGLVNGKNLQRYTRVFYKFSDNDGITWSDRIEITGVLNSNEAGMPNRDEKNDWITDANGFPCDYLGRAFHMPGPGHGIQLSNGRLLLQLWNRKALGTIDNGEIPVNERDYGLSTIYSDDHGGSWKYGSSFGHKGLNCGESRIAELENGDIYLNTRYTNVNSKEKNNRRMVSISHNNGKDWDKVAIDENFPLSNPCDGGLITIKDKKQNKMLLLYSKNESQKGRENLVVRLSYDNGKTWPVLKVVDTGTAWYSDLAVLPDNTIALIYETGKNNPVYCVRFNLEWLKTTTD